MAAFYLGKRCIQKTRMMFQHPRFLYTAQLLKYNLAGSGNQRSYPNSIKNALFGSA